MAIIYYKTKDEVPTDLADVATEVKEDGDFKGQWAVNVVPRKKLEEFRDGNTALAKKAEDSERLLKGIFSTIGVSKVEDFDPAKFTEDYVVLKDTARKVSDGKLKASDDIDKVVAERIEHMKSRYETELQAKAVEAATYKRERDEKQAAYMQTFVDRAVSAVCNDNDLGVERSAIDDIMNRARSVFKVEEDGSLTPKTRSGQTMWGEDGATPMTVKEWVSITLRKEAPHYFQRSNGGAAGGGAETKQFGGFTEAEFDKLSPERRLEIANRMVFQKTNRK